MNLNLKLWSMFVAYTTTVSGWCYSVNVLKVQHNNLSILSNIKNASSSPQDASNIPHRCISVSINNINVNGYGDTFSANDNVQNQYVRLPYPLISDEEYQQEKRYYENHDRIKPFRIHHNLVLDRLNHFLYNGENNFS